MSPKSNRSGVSYDDSDPRHHSLNPQASPVAGPRVTRAQDMDAAVEGLPTTEDLERARSDRDEMNDSSVNEDQREPGGLEEVQYVEGDGTGEALPEAKPDYSTPQWTKARLNAELDNREIVHDPKASNPVLIDLLEADDEHRAQHGDGTPPSGT